VPLDHDQVTDVGFRPILYLRHRISPSRSAWSLSAVNILGRRPAKVVVPSTVKDIVGGSGIARRRHFWALGRMAGVMVALQRRRGGLVPASRRRAPLLRRSR
jgi:hypothetical protein